MYIFDLHCDVLNKLASNGDIRFLNDHRLNANYERLHAGQIKVQVFAIFISPKIPQDQKFNMALRQIEAFQTQVLTAPGMVHIKSWDQLLELKDNQIGAVLSLEGCDCIGTDLEKLKTLIDAGVKIVGLTWNYENEVAYGNLEDPDKGLKPFAKEVIHYLNERDIILDVAHLNEKGFYELLPIAKHIIASHCNSKALCDNPRNLTDEQVRLLVNKGGRIHVVFYPPFIENNKEHTSIDQLVQHIQHLVNLVGIEHVGFGSDFDGMDPLFVSSLANASDYQNLINVLLQYFSEEEVKLVSYNGFVNYALSI